MKFVRGILLAIAAALVLAAVAAGLALDSHVQTWVVRRYLARRPGLGASVDSVRFGLYGGSLRHVQLVRRGSVLTLPYVEIEMPLIPALFGGDVRISHLSARGWTLNASPALGSGLPTALTHPEERAAGKPAAPALSAPTAAYPAHPAPRVPYPGVLDRLQLPVNFALESLDSEGDIALPVAPGRAAGRIHVLASGGGLAAGQEGTFEFSLSYAPLRANDLVNSVVADGTLAASMDTPRTFRMVRMRIDAAAAGPRLRRPVRLSADLEASRGVEGETYSLTLERDARELASVRASYPDARGRVAGSWKIDIADQDLRPFALGRALPAFDGVGQGGFDADPGLSDIHMRGRLDVDADRLAMVSPRLAGVGAVRIGADFDLTRQGGTLRVDAFRGSLQGSRPILTLRGLQAFAFDPSSGELTVADASRDIFEATLQDVPLDWAQPYLHGVVVSGGSLRGSLSAGARNGGLSLRSGAPLTISHLTATRGGDQLLHDLSLSFSAAAEYGHQGWEIEMNSRGAAAGGVAGQAAPMSLYQLEARVGRLADPGEPVKLTGRLSVSLPALLAQPGMAGSPESAEPGGAALLSGSAVCDFAASAAAKPALELKLRLSDLSVGTRTIASAVDSGAEERSGVGLNPPVDRLPDVSADILLEFAHLDRIAFEAPFVITRDGRTSDVDVTGTASQIFDGLRINGKITGSQVYLEDARILGALLAVAGRGPLAGSAGAVGVASPPSSRERGTSTGEAAPSATFSLALKKLIAPQFSATNVTGGLGLASSEIRFDGLHATLEGAGDASASGALVEDGDPMGPWSFETEVSLGSFNPAALFQKLYPGRQATVEGKFNVAGRFSGRGASPFDAWAGAHGSLAFSSNGGVLHLFAMDASRLAQARKVAILGMFIGDLTGAASGRRELGQAIAKVAAKIESIPYDQMSFTLERDPSFATNLKDFALISPEVRLQGTGQVSYAAGVPMLARPLSAEFTLRARGDTAQAFKVVGLLGAKADDLGYYPFTEPLRIAGTLGRPDTSQLQSALLRDIYKNSGASDFIDKLLGK